MSKNYAHIGAALALALSTSAFAQQLDFKQIKGKLPASQLAAGAAVGNIGFTPLNPANNLSEVDPAASRVHLGLGTVIVPTSAADFNTKIATAIGAGVTSVKVTQGTYSLEKTGTNAQGYPAASLISNPGNLVIDFQGSTLAMSGTDVSSMASVLGIDNAVPGTTQVIRNVVLKFANPPFVRTQMTAKTACVSNANGSATFKVLDSYNPSWSVVGEITQFDVTTGLENGFIYATYSGGLPVTNLGGGSYSVAFNGSTPCTALGTMTVNNYYGLMNAITPGDGFYAYRVGNLVFDNVQVLNGGHGIAIAGAGNVTFKNGSGVFPAISTIQSWRSSNLGGISITAAAGIVTTDPTTVSLAAGDDSLFVAPYQTNIVSVASRTSMIVNGGSIPLVVGDILEFVDTNGVDQGFATVTVATPSGGNTQITLAGSGAPSGVAATWTVYDKTSVPTLCKIEGGIFGASPTRGVYANCQETEMHHAHVADTNAPAFLAESDYHGIGYPSALIDVSDNDFERNNGAAGNSQLGTVNVIAWGQSGLALTGHYGKVVVKNNRCNAAGSGCTFVSSTTKAVVQSEANESYYGLGVAPGIYPVCANSPWQYGESFCNDATVDLAGSTFGDIAHEVIFGSNIGSVDLKTPYNFPNTNIPACGTVATLGSEVFVTNGIASPTYHQTFSATGGATWKIGCNTDGTTSAWRY